MREISDLPTSENLGLPTLRANRSRELKLKPAVSLILRFSFDIKNGGDQHHGTGTSSYRRFGKGNIDGPPFLPITGTLKNCRHQK